ncbi:MAG: membrane protein insertion efficiency factor YidD [Ignavibacteria bacterium]|nr:membrane protein insertion efficiency factor YidD [Ignavibacteria bacterium]
MKYLLMGIIKIYQVLISPILPSSCRFYPTCSVYFYDSLNIHGFFKGSYLGIKRILKCNPFFEGGIDHVPPKANFKK